MTRLIPIAVALCALTLAACGGNDESAGTQPAAATQAGGGEPGGRGPAAMFTEEQRSCLAEQGVELPDRPEGGAPPEGATVPEGGAPPEGGFPAGGGPGGDMSDGDRQAMQAAFEACGVETGGGPRGGGAGPGDVSDPEYQARVEAFVGCMRENGVDLPDPDFSGDGPVFDAEAADQDDETFRTASAACQSELRPSS